MPKHRRADRPFPAKVWEQALALRDEVTRVALRYPRLDMELDDLVQVGLIAACRAIQAYRPGRGKVEALVQVAARRAFMDATWRTNLVHVAPSMSRRWAVRATYDGHSAVSTIAGRVDRIDQEEWRRVVAAGRLLEADEWFVIHRRFGLFGGPDTFDELGYRMGRHPKAVSRLYRRALPKLVLLLNTDRSR